MSEANRSIDPKLPVDHKEAWDLAHFKRENSNLARCYIELHYLLRELTDIEGPQPGHVDWYRKVQAVLEPITKAP